MTNIMMIGGAGFRNSGDEALLLSCVQICKDCYPSANLILAANNIEVAQHTLEGYGIKYIPSPRFAFFRCDHHYGMCDDVFKSRWNKLRDHLIFKDIDEARLAIKEHSDLDFIDRQQSIEFFEALCESEIVVIHGGGILTSATRSRLWEQALSVELARRLGKRVLLRSHQIGPFSDEEDKSRIRTIINHSSFISTRDFQQSSKEVSLIYPNANVHQSIDDAFLACVRQDGVLDRYNLSNGQYICFGYRQNPGVGVSSESLHRSIELIKAAHELFRMPVVLLPQGPFDMAPLEQIGSMLDVPHKIIAPHDGFRDPIAIASQARLMIACPHHSLVFALRGSVPIISPVSGQYYMFKNKGSMRFFGLEDYVFDIDSDDYLSVGTDLLRKILVEGDNLRKMIAMKLNELRVDAMKNNLEFARVLLGRES